MTTPAQVAANQRNSKLSTGPRSYKCKCKSRLNSVRHGMRSKLISTQLILPGESKSEFQRLLEDVRASLGPRDKVEELMARGTVRLSWNLTRIETSRDERLATRAKEAVGREKDEVEKLGVILFRDCRGPLALQGIEKYVQGQKRSSGSDNVDDPDRPAKVLKTLESTALGCRFLLEQWKSIAERVNKNQRVQSHDRFRAIRLLGRDRLDALKDSRVALIFLASFALHPGRRPAYADLRDELNVRSFPRVVERIRIQWPDVLDTNDTPRARFLLTELISGAMARLTAKLEAHEDHADEHAANRDIQARYDATPQGEQMQLAELRFQGAFKRSIAAFQQYRKEKRNAGELNDEGVWLQVQRRRMTTRGRLKPRWQSGQAPGASLGPGGAGVRSPTRAWFKFKPRRVTASGWLGSSRRSQGAPGVVLGRRRKSSRSNRSRLSNWLRR